MRSPEFHCPDHGAPLSRSGDGRFVCPDGCEFPVLRDIPRFVPADNYAASFGLQWNTFRKTQLDSHTGVTISTDRLTRLVGGDLGILAGKKVLEAGCGAGRFSEVMLKAGAELTAIDLSDAVEANLANCRHHDNYAVAQADIYRLPFQPRSFDVVVSVGVIQHTPDPERTIAALCAQVAPGGLLVIDHYRPQAIPPRPASRRMRAHLLRKDPEYCMRFVERLVDVLWPVHRLLYRVRGVRWLTPARKWLLRQSPILDYQYELTALTPRQVREWAILDTHDAHTDFYQHRRTVEQIESCLKGEGMTDLVVQYGGNGVEARATRPA